MKKLRVRFMVYSAVAMGSLCETVGCAQLLGNAFRDGTRSFLESGLTAALLGSLNIEELLGLSGS